MTTHYDYILHFHDKNHKGGFPKKNKGKNEIGTFSSDTPPPYPKSERNNSENWFTV